MLIGQLSIKRTEITKSVETFAPGLFVMVSEKSNEDSNLYRDLFTVIESLESIGKSYGEKQIARWKK